MDDELVLPVEPAADPIAEGTVADATTTETSPAPIKESEITDKAQKRIDYLTWKTRELERRLQGQAPVQPEPQAPAKRPTMSEFEFDETRFQAAESKWLEQIIDRGVTERLAKAESERTIKDQTSSFQKREAEFVTKNPDYQSLVYRDPNEGGPAISEMMAAVIAHSDAGPALALHLAKNPEVSRHIYDLPDMAAVYELGKIEARMGGKTAAVVPITSSVQATKAPPPVPKIEATEPAVSKNPVDMSASEFARWRRKYM